MNLNHVNTFILPGAFQFSYITTLAAHFRVKHLFLIKIYYVNMTTRLRKSIQMKHLVQYKPLQLEELDLTPDGLWFVFIP